MAKSKNPNPMDLPDPEGLPDGPQRRDKPGARRGFARKPQRPPAPPPEPEVPAPIAPAPQLEGDFRVADWEADEIRRIAAELAARKVEALRLYEPMPVQGQFHASLSRIRLVRGSNRGGKTLAAAVEVARAAAGCDPHRKYPDKDGRFFCVGKNLDHVGQVMWRKLGRAGAFKIIRDRVTGQWRAFRPWTAEDKEREHEAKLAPPLIPPRLIKTIAWENKAKGIPKQVMLRNGWELSFYSSEGKPPNGVDIDGWWFDEEITDEEWYTEMVARLLDRSGRGIWSATPQAGTEKLYDLHEEAEKQAHLKRPRVSEHISLLAHNLHISADEKEQFAENLMDEDERLVRVEGEFAVSRRRVFPEYSHALHLCEPFALPAEWTRYAIIDPGRQVCAVLFAAIPPPEVGDFCYLYDELYIKNCDAALFAHKMAQRGAGQAFEAFLIDHQGSRLTDIGGGMTVERQYSSALKKQRVQSRRTGYDFIWGNPDVEAGLSAFRAWLLPREDGTCKLRILRGKLPNFDWEIKHYRFKMNGDWITDKPEDKGRVHLMATARYAAMGNLRHVRRQGGKAQVSPVVAALKSKRAEQARRNRDGGGSLVHLGPGKGGRW